MEIMMGILKVGLVIATASLVVLILSVISPKWFGKWWRWTWPLVILASIFIWWVVHAINGISTRGSFLFPLTLAVVGIAIYRLARGVMPPVWMSITAICIPLFLWGLSVVQLEWYTEWRNSGHFWWMIVTAVVLSWLTTHTNNVVARTAKKGLLLLMIIAVGIGAYSKLKGSVTKLFSSNPAPIQSSSTRDLPADVVLPIIAECESGGKQFEDDGKTPLKNKQGSSAIGKYQILATLHEERAKKLGHDIRTEEGNEAYARLLFAESHTTHWEADPSSRACWEPKLVALGYQQATPLSPTPIGTKTLVLTEDNPTSVISILPLHSWKLVGEIPTTGWTTDNGYRDALGNRIQVFKLVSPAKEVKLEAIIARCATAQTCVW